MKEIRQISPYVQSVKDKYYIADDGSIYCELSNSKVMKNGEKRRISAHLRRQAMSIDSPKWTIPFKDWGTYCLVLKNGTMLRRLKTQLKYTNNKYEQVGICLNLITEEQKYFYVSRLVASVFIGNLKGKEVHHIDRDRKNNNVSNLQILSKEDHMKIHSSKGELGCATTRAL